MKTDYKLEWNDKEVIRDVDKIIDKVSKEGAEKVAADARRLVPVKTGALKKSIKVSKSKFEGGGHVVSAGGGDLFYASFVELGRSGAPAHPFLRAALAYNKPKIRKAFRDALK